MARAYINDEVVVKEAQRRLQAHLPITWEGNQYNPMHAWTVLIGASGMGASIAAVCREGRDAPSDNIVRETLTEQGWDDRIIETACNDLLAHSARQCPWKGCFPVAIDLHEEPFYGQPPADDPEVIRRGEAKAGTTYFHTFATAYVIRQHRRLTLAATRVRAHQSMLEVADRLRQRVEALGIEVQVYLLDPPLRKGHRGLTTPLTCDHCAPGGAQWIPSSWLPEMATRFVRPSSWATSFTWTPRAKNSPMNFCSLPSIAAY
jgi:hypothetical protein